MLDLIRTAAATEPATLTRWSLQAGQTQMLWVDEGWQLHLAQGELALLTPPVWLAETPHRTQHSLRSGHNLALTQRGWVHLHAQSESHIVLHTVTADGWRWWLSRLVQVFCG